MGVGDDTIEPSAVWGLPNLTLLCPATFVLVIGLNRFLPRPTRMSPRDASIAVEKYSARDGPMGIFFLLKKSCISQYIYIITAAHYFQLPLLLASTLIQAAHPAGSASLLAGCTPSPLGCRYNNWQALASSNDHGTTRQSSKT